MNCTDTQTRLKGFLSGKLEGSESRDVRLHLASCARCASVLNDVDRVEVLPAIDETVELSESFHDRFLSRLEAHRTRQAGARRDSNLWWNRLSRWSMPRRLAAAGAVAAVLFLGIYWSVFRVNEDLDPLPADITIAENLPLLKDMKVIENLDLLEDFDSIEALGAGSKSATAVH
jgi:anti-sigma factor RsiW